MKPTQTEIKVCPTCNHSQDISDKTWQDIKGKFTICEKCGDYYGVEPKEGIL